MFGKPSAALMRALRDFVMRHEIFVEAREFDDGRIFTRRPWPRSKRLGPRRHFEVLLRRDRRRVRFFTQTCGSEGHKRSQVWVDFPEKVLLRPAEAAIEYEACGRDVKRYVARFPKDSETGRALFGYVRSESRILRQLLGDAAYEELLRIVRRRGRYSRGRRRS
ncbi:MAG: hypothetical protein LAO77_02615 [Acidobacteriia bacterium]|nr:hypothetical protein [Terriglobia bacterium]